MSRRPNADRDYGAIDAARKRQIEAAAGDAAMSAVPSNDPDPVEEMHLARLRPKALAAFARLPETSAA